MANSQYFSEEDEQSGGSAGGVIGGGGSGAGPAGAAPASGGGGGTGFVNLQQYLDANQSGAAQVAGALTEDLGSQVAETNQGVADTTAQGMSTAQGLDTAGVGAGADISEGAQNEAVAGLEAYGMDKGLQDSYQQHTAAQADQQNYGSNLAENQDTRQAAVQRLYGSGRGSGFGQLDAFLAGTADSGLRSGVESQLGQQADIGASRANVQGSIDAANQARQDNTAAQYGSARQAEAQRQAQAQAEQTARETESISANSDRIKATGDWGEGEGDSYDAWATKQEGWGEGEGEGLEEFLRRTGR